MDTARAVSAFAAVSLLFSAVPYSSGYSLYFVKIIRLVLCGIKRRALVPLRVSFVCVLVRVVHIGRANCTPGAAALVFAAGLCKLFNDELFLQKCAVSLCSSV